MMICFGTAHSYTVTPKKSSAPAKWYTKRISGRTSASKK